VLVPGVQPVSTWSALIEDCPVTVVHDDLNVGNLGGGPDSNRFAARGMALSGSPPPYAVRGGPAGPSHGPAEGHLPRHLAGQSERAKPEETR